MARKSSVGSGLALIVLVIIGAIAKYAGELLIICIVVATAWIIYKLLLANQAKAPPSARLADEASPTPPLVPVVKSPLPAVTRFAPRGADSQVDPRGPSISDGGAYWLPRTRSVELAGRTLGGGFYFGSGLQSIKLGSPEPALIDPRLPVDRAVAECTVRRLEYWPSYSRASSAARGAYLNWLASGRKDPSADLGYVFLYFYGLERRALYDASVSQSAKDELPEIRAEVERLLAIYGRSGSFQLYAGSLLDILKYRVVDSGLYKMPPPPPRAYNALGLVHRVALGQCANDASPLPPEWAYTWFLGEPTTRLRTPATRCPAEFKQLFLQTYAGEFGAGLMLPKSKTRIALERRPASPTFGIGAATHTLRFDLPDVTLLTAPVRKLQDVAEHCYPQLESYSRLVGKDPSRAGTFDAMLELPLALWADRNRRVMENIRKIVSEGGIPAAVPFEKFRSWFPEWQTTTRAKMLSLARVLSDAGLGMEPDLRFGGAVPGLGSPIVFFADDKASAMPSPTARYTAAALTMQLGAAVAMADGAPSDVEKGMMTRQLEEWLHLSESECRRLRAFTRLVLASPPKLNGIKAKVDALDKSQRVAVGDFLTLIAQADTKVTAAEVRTLEKSYHLLGLDQKDVYSKLHVAAIEPISVVPGRGENGHPIPRPPPARLRTGVVLDPAKIAALQKDSERVSVILGSIFTDEPVAAEPEPRPDEDERTSAPAAGLLGLRPIDSAFVSTLVGRPHWTRAELEELAVDRGFMLDGVLERINDASLDKFDKSLLEGDDPIEVNPDVVRELLQ
ncbi:MAG: TerB N-terminal domain-containing protein [Bradyrhizobium sp.]